MSQKTRLLTDTIAVLQRTINNEKALVKELETQLRDVNASRKASEEEAQTLMIENGKLRRAIDKVLFVGCASRVEMQATFDREMGA